MVSSYQDERRHVEWIDNQRPTKHRLTLCGQRVAPFQADGDDEPCPVCLPAEAHPLAVVWDYCRRLDDRFNAGAGEPRG